MQKSNNINIDIYFIILLKILLRKTIVFIFMLIIETQNKIKWQTILKTTLKLIIRLEKHFGEK